MKKEKKKKPVRQHKWRKPYPALRKQGGTVRFIARKNPKKRNALAFRYCGISILHDF